MNILSINKVSVLMLIEWSYWYTLIVLNVMSNNAYRILNTWFNLF